MNLYTANCTQNAQNTIYRNAVDINGIEELKAAAQYDHVAAEMRNGHRGSDDFMKSDCIMLDLDNTHCEEPDEWKGIKDIAEAFPDVKFYYIQSRNHMREKTKTHNGKTQHYAPREKYHCYFPLSRTYDNIEEYEATMLKAAGLFPYFDLGAAKPAQFFFGVKGAEGGEEPGDLTLDGYLETQRPEDVKEAVRAFERKVKDGTYKGSDENRKAVSRLYNYMGLQPESEGIEVTEGQPETEQGETESSHAINMAERKRALYWLKDWTSRHGVQVNGYYKINTKAHPHAVCLKVECPWKEEHSMDGAANEAVLIVEAGGKLNFLCRHSHGWKYGWKEYRAFYEERDAAAEMEAAEEAAKEEYMQTNAAAEMRNFLDGINASVNTPAISTGFNNLDEVLDGGLYEGLYIIGAVSSLGKTTLALQIIDQIAQQGQDCLVFSLEMARSELIAKSISRLTYQFAKDKALAKTTRGITAGARYKTYSKPEKDHIYSAMRMYKKFAEHIFIHEGVGNIGAEQIKEIVLRHISITGNKPVVLIDYLQILAPADIRASDKQNTDKGVLELKRLSRDCKIPVIGISSFNRDNYMQPVNNASFKESGAIEYGADVLLGLQYEGMDYKEGETDGARQKRIRELIKDMDAAAKGGKAQHLQAKVLKNRNGSRGQALFDFYAMFNCFREQEGWQPADKAADDVFAAVREAKAR